MQSADRQVWLQYDAVDVLEGVVRAADACKWCPRGLLGEIRGLLPRWMFIQSICLLGTVTGEKEIDRRSLPREEGPEHHSNGVENPSVEERRVVFRLFNQTPYSFEDCVPSSWTGRAGDSWKYVFESEGCHHLAEQVGWAAPEGFADLPTLTGTTVWCERRVMWCVHKRNRLNRTS